MDRITRSKLKRDDFALEVSHGIEYFGEHRKQVAMYAGIAVAVVALIWGVSYYRSRQRTARQAELAKAMQVQEAPVTPVAPPGAALFFPNANAKSAEAMKQFQGIIQRHGGTDEACIAAQYMGAMLADQGDLNAAERYFKQVMENGPEDYASIAKLSLAQVYFATGKTGEGEKLLRALIEKPTTFVSKEQASLALAKGLAASKPAEARKLLEPLRTERPAVSQAAITALAELPNQ